MNYITRPGKLFFFEKWYFDVQDDAGLFLFAYMAPLRLAGFQSAELVVSLYAPGKPEMRESFHLSAGEFSVSPDRESVTFSRGSIASTGEVTRLDIQAGDWDIRLDYHAAAAPWVPGGDALLLEHKKNSLFWSVPVPRARVEGTISRGDMSLAIRGLGYHDFVQTDIPPWRLPLRELLWGRALGENDGVIWNRPVFKNEKETLPVMHGWAQVGDEVKVFTRVAPVFTRSESHAATAGSYPEEMDISLENAAGDSLKLTLDNTRLLLGAEVADVQHFRHPLERMLYRRFTGNPVEYKLFSGCRIGAEALQLQAAHEWVLWGGAR